MFFIKKIFSAFDLFINVCEIVNLFKIYNKRLRFFKFVPVFVLVTNACTVSNLPVSYNQKLISRSLSINDSSFRTCVFDDGYRILHFPMYHTPPSNQNLNSRDFETITKSQFQLLHTLLDYNRKTRMVVFDENITSDFYNSSYLDRLQKGLQQTDTYSRLDGQTFFLSERQSTAQSLFGAGIPAFYEYLSQPQKEYLYNVGASLTLYLVGEIPQLYKVISEQKLDVVKANLGGDYTEFNLNQSTSAYWLYDFREVELKSEIQSFYRINTNTDIVFIAYGKLHDLSDDFFGYPFQSGHSFCLEWENFL